MNIYQKISEVMKDVKYVQKTGYNSFHKYNYAKESDYIETLRPSLLKHGLVIVPHTQTVQQRSLDTGELSTVEMEFRIVNIDNPEEFVTIPSAGQGMDKGDKGVYKAITGAKKYMLSLAFLIETGDDAEEDSKLDEDLDKKKKPTKAESKAAQKAATADNREEPVVSTQEKKKSSFEKPGSASEHSGEVNGSSNW